MKKIHVGYLPKTAVDIQKVAEQVILGLTADSLELKWYNNAQFQQDCDRLKVLNLKRIQEKGTRMPVTKALQTLNKEIDKHIKYIKLYLEDAYGFDNAKSRYPDFGIIYKNSSYRLPNDQNDRLVALDAIVIAIVTHNFSNKTYGLSYWQDIRDKYAQSLNIADTTDTNSSLTVQEKNDLINKLSKAMEATTYLLRANFPDNYEAKMLNYGFYRSKN